MDRAFLYHRMKTVFAYMISEILSEDACLSIKDLAITGWDLQQIGLAPGPEMGRCLNWLLGQVQDEVLSNEKALLLETVKKLLED